MTRPFNNDSIVLAEYQPAASYVDQGILLPVDLVICGDPSQTFALLRRAHARPHAWP